MHRTRVIALVIASLVSTASVAGAQSRGKAERAPRAARAMGRGMEDARADRGAMLRGIKLSETEKAKVKEIRAKYREEMKTLNASLKPALAEAREARQKGDSQAVKAVVQRTNAQREQLRTLMAKEVAEIRGALSPENQQAFDVNVQKAARRGAKGAKGAKGARGDKAGRGLKGRP